MGFLKSIGRRLSGDIGAASGSLARFDVPGSEQVELPAGEAHIYLEERRPQFTADGDGQLDYSLPADLEVSVRAGRDDALPLKEPRMRLHYAESVRTFNRRAKADFVRAPVGTIQVPAAGTYTVKASGTIDPDTTQAELLID
jgi:hypothetical protein